MQTIKHFFGSFIHRLHFTTPVAIIIAALILSASHVAYGVIVGKKGSTTATTAFNGRAVDESDLVTGNKKSKVVLIAYSDTECPFCAQLHPTLKQIQDEYGDKIAFAYRYFPLTQIHPNAFEEARAIHCVGKVAGAETRLRYINAMFDYKWSKKNMTLPKGEKENMAETVGVNRNAFGACMQDQTSSDVITASIQDGVSAGVQGTPASFVLLKTKKGYETVSLVDGARPFEFFKVVIDDALER